MVDATDGRVVAAALLVSAGGHVLHNLAEFPVGILLGPETLVPLAVTILLGVGWLVRRGRGTYAAMAAWAAIVLVVGGGSVLPLEVLPFAPEQSVAHYAAHLLYAVAQLPLLGVGVTGVRAAATEGSERVQRPEPTEVAERGEPTREADR